MVCQMGDQEYKTVNNTAVIKGNSSTSLNALHHFIIGGLFMVEIHEVIKNRSRDDDAQS